MKAVRIHEHGGPEVLVYEDVPDPEPGPRQVLVRVEAATVNPVDVAVREGRFPTPKQPPKILGSDGAGVVERVGAEVTSVRPGDEVIFSGLGIGSEGSYAEYALIAEAQAVPKPPSILMTMIPCSPIATTSFSGERRTALPVSVACSSTPQADAIAISIASTAGGKPVPQRATGR